MGNLHMRSVEAALEEEKTNYSDYDEATDDAYDYDEPFEFLDQEDMRSLENSDLVFSPSRLQRVVDRWGCTHDDAIRYLAYLEDGYHAYEAGVLAGIRDPDE